MSGKLPIGCCCSDLTPGSDDNLRQTFTSNQPQKQWPPAFWAKGSGSGLGLGAYYRVITDSMSTKNADFMTLSSAKIQHLTPSRLTGREASTFPQSSVGLSATFFTPGSAKQVMKKFQIVTFATQGSYFSTEFMTLDFFPKSQGSSASGISIFEIFQSKNSGGILVNLASRSCMNVQYPPRQDGCAYSFASRDQITELRVFTGLQRISVYFSATYPRDCTQPHSAYLRLSHSFSTALFCGHQHLGQG